MATNFSAPSTYDFLRPNGFSLVIDGIPDVNFNCQAVAFPGLSLNAAILETPFIAIPLSGDKIQNQELSITFIVSEEMQNYLEVVDWIIALGFPNDYSQFRNLKNISKNTKSALKDNTPMGLEFSDATLFIYSSANNPKLAFRFKKLVPVSISNIDFDLRTTSVEYVTATADFKFDSYQYQIL